MKYPLSTRKSVANFFLFLSKGIMSYSSLIDPVYQIFKSSRSKDSNGQDSVDKFDESHHDDEKDEAGGVETGKTGFKKGKKKAVSALFFNLHFIFYLLNGIVYFKSRRKLVCFS